ncbi:MAG: hypothetical protein BroJett030_09390 [Alphaproteobacteria bacterium]|nr:MAG: hypothetical protein BroJett030_09390 [Alphaproteobacteria bacterium]
MRRTVLVFDIDGTLTASRRPMEPALALVLADVLARHAGYLVTGSDYAKVVEQIPTQVLVAAAGTFTCVGNELWRGGRAVFSMRHRFPDAMIEAVQALMAQSPYGVRTGRHVEERAGTLNVSVVGRNADAAQRADYQRHDSATGERHRLIAAIERQFPDYEARRGGQISIDISPRGWNKSRVLAEIKARHGDPAVHFFADNLQAAGNDRPLAEALAADGPHHRVHAVTDWRETLAILERDYAARRRRGRVDAA